MDRVEISKIKDGANQFEFNKNSIEGYTPVLFLFDQAVGVRASGCGVRSFRLLSHHTSPRILPSWSLSSPKLVHERQRRNFEKMDPTLCESKLHLRLHGCQPPTKLSLSLLIPGIRRAFHHLPFLLCDLCDTPTY